MARNLENRTNVIAPDATNPFGKVQDESAPGASDGTPVNEALTGDIFVFFQKLLNDAGITANELADDAVNGFQLFQAFLDIQNAISTSAAVSTFKPVITPAIDTSNPVIDIRSIETDGSQYVALNISGGNDRAWTSPDGITWTSRNTPAGLTFIRDVAWSPDINLFCAVSSGEAGGTGDRIMTSPDGITWTIRTPAEDEALFGVAWGNGLFVAVGNDGVGVQTSPDGITWTVRPNPAALPRFGAVTFADNLFVATGTSGPDIIMTSPDGITWTLRTIPVGSNNVAGKAGYSSSLGLWAVGSTGEIWTSPDAITWTAIETAENNFWRAISFGNGIFCGIASSGTNKRQITSVNGVSWFEKVPTQPTFLADIVFGHTGQFLIVSADGDSAILIS